MPGDFFVLISMTIYDVHIVNAMTVDLVMYVDDWCTCMLIVVVEWLIALFVKHAHVYPYICTSIELFPIVSRIYAFFIHHHDYLLYALYWMPCLVEFMCIPLRDSNFIFVIRIFEWMISSTKPCRDSWQKNPLMVLLSIFFLVLHVWISKFFTKIYSSKFSTQNSGILLLQPILLYSVNILLSSEY